mgnify:CR=1 FL=1
MSYEDRLALARSFVAQYNAVMAGLSAGLGGGGGGSGGGGSGGGSSPKTGTATLPNGVNLPVTIVNGRTQNVGLPSGTVVHTAGGDYEITGRSAGNYTSKKKYAKGGVVDFTDIVQVDGSPTKSETIFNSTDSSKLYDLIHNNSVPDIASKIFGNLVKPISNLPPPPIASGGESNQYVINATFPNVSSVEDIKQAFAELPNFVLQKKFKR